MRLPDLYGSASAVIEHIRPGANVVVGSGNGEPVTVIDAIEDHDGGWNGVRLHQMLALRERRHHHGEVPELFHVSYFLSEATRTAYRTGTCDPVPNNFSDVPRLLRQTVRPDLVVTAVSAPDRHGYPVDCTNNPSMIYLSSSGGQGDFARGAVALENGRAFIVLHSTTRGDTISRIVPQLSPGAAVTTFKNIVDHVVTEHGVAELRGVPIAERTRRLISIAHPRFREELTAQAYQLGFLPRR